MSSNFRGKGLNLTFNISSQLFYDFSLFLMLISVTAHASGTGIDSIIGIVALGLFCLNIILNIFLRNGSNIRFSVCLIQYLIFYGYYYLSITWGNFDDASCYIVRFFKILLLVLYITQNKFTEENINKFLNIILFSIFYFVIKVIISTPISDWGTERLGMSANINSNTVGMYCALGFMVCLYLAEKKKLYYFFCTFLFILALFSGSRKALVMLFVGFFVYTVLKAKSKKTFFNVIITFVVLIVAFIIIMKVPKLYNVLGYRIDKIVYSAFGFTFGNTNDLFDSSATERSFYRNYAMYMFKNHIFFGNGANSFVTEMRNIGYKHIAYSHCNYTELLATMGIVGFLLYYSIYVLTFINLYKTYKYTKNDMYLCFLVIIFLVFIIDYYVVMYIDIFVQVFCCYFNASAMAILRKKKYSFINDKIGN